MELILKYTTSTLLVRDIDGSTPLHCAVQRGFGAITEAIVAVAPNDALYMENGVGETPLDMSNLQRTLEIIPEYTSTMRWPKTPSVLSVDVSRSLDSPVEVETLEKELPKLRETLSWLEAGGVLVKGTRVAREVEKFAERMEGVLVERRARRDAAIAKSGENDEGAENPPLRKGPVDREDRARTLKAVKDAVAAAPRKRLLIHLLDVQRSVRGNLTRCAEETKLATAFDDRDGLLLDEGKEGDEREGSLVYEYVKVKLDTT